MKDIPVADARCFAIMGHTSSGKTSLVDAMLFKLGLTDRLGAVAAGSSVADYTDEEKNRRITIFAKPFSAVFKAPGGRKYGLTFCDTPGYQDFYGQVIAACRAVDAALIAVDAVAGVQVGTHRVWKCCQREGVSAKGIVVTGLDRENADFDAVLEKIQGAFGAGCVPVVVPLPDRSGVIDVLGAKSVPPALAERVTELKGQLVELAAETNDALIEKFLEGQELSAQEIADGLVAAVASGRLVPVFAALPLKDVGITELMEGIGRLFPSPERAPRRDAEGREVAVAADAPFAGQVWRSVNDPYVGQISFVRVAGGTIAADSEVFNASRGQKERIGALLVLTGKKQETAAQATAGDIVAIPKLKATGVSDTLCAAGQSVKFAPLTFPKPVVFQAVRAKTQADEDRLGTALTRVCDEDPTLQVERNTETKEIVLQGLGDVHIDVAVGLMKSRSNAEVVLDTPKVPYRETVTGRAEGHYKHKKQSGGRGQYGEVYLRIAPKRPDDAEWFEDAIVGGAIPNNFIPAVQKGVVEGMLAGAVAGYPVTDIKVSLYDGTFHDVDSSEIAFKIAGGRALKDALAKAKPVLLEPIMSVKVFIPEQFLGDINGDLNHRRGRIQGLVAEEGLQVIQADVPQAELFRYAAELRSMTGGQGTFEMEFSRYEIVPANVAQKVVAQAQKTKTEDEE